MDKWLIKKNVQNVQNINEEPETNIVQNFGVDTTRQLEVGAANVVKVKNVSNDITKIISKTTKKRKYNELFLQHGFTYTRNDEYQRQVCVICNESLASESIKPTKLKRHLETKHPAHLGKPLTFFERLLKSSTAQQQCFEKHTKVQEKYLLASYQASYLISKSKKLYTIGEALALPIAIKITETLHGKKYADELKKIPLSNDTVSKRISEISDDQFKQLIDRIKKTVKFSIQLDESTDITNSAQLLAYVRYCYDGSIHEDLLFCRQLSEHSTGESIYQKVDEFFTENYLKWSNCVGVCTDGAAAMTGKNIGFLAKVKSTNKNIIFTHCMIHRESLVAKKLSIELNSVLQDSIKIINFIKSRALNTRLFVNLSKDMSSNYEKLLLHTEVRWLSRGLALKRLVELKHEVMLFLIKRKPDYSNLFHDDHWICKLSYLSDILENLNELNMSLQRESTYIFVLNDKIKAFLKKIIKWKNTVKNGSFEMFSFTNDFITENNLCGNIIKNTVIDHLETLEKQFEQYFSSDFNIDQFRWVQNPFNAPLESVKDLTLHAQEEFAELSSDSKLKVEFLDKGLNSFWISVKAEFPTLSNIALSMILPFATTYLCDSAFSTLILIKNKHRSCIKNVEIAMRPAMSNISPRLDLCKNKQGHPSH